MGWRITCESLYHKAILPIAMFPLCAQSQTLPSSSSYASQGQNWALREGQGLNLSYYPDSTRLMDVYVEMGDLEERGRGNFSLQNESLNDVANAPYSFRTGFTYKLGKAFNMNFDARRRKIDSALNLSPDNDDTRIKFNARPWEFRMTFSYRWGKRRF